MPFNKRETPKTDITKFYMSWRLSKDPSPDEAAAALQDASDCFEQRWGVCPNYAWIHPSKSSTAIYKMASELGIELEEKNTDLLLVNRIYLNHGDPNLIKDFGPLFS